VPYDGDEDYLFGGIDKTAASLSLFNSNVTHTIAQIFERISLLINSSDNSLGACSAAFVGDPLGSNLRSKLSTRWINSLKLELRDPYSIILKDVLLSGIDGFNTGTNGSAFIS
jgi:hypothetical protein